MSEILNNEGDNNTQDQPDNISQEPTLTEEQVMSFLRGKGIETDSFETLKQKAEYKIPEPEPTDEAKKAAEAARDQLLLQVHLKRGGTIDQFTQFKSLASSATTELGLQKTRKEYIDSGFTAEQADELIRQAHFDVKDEDLEGLDDEERSNLLKRREFGKQKIDKRGQYLQNTAKSYLQSLEQEIKDRDEEKVKMEQHASNVEAALKSFQRKQQLQLGQIDGQDVSPVDYEIPEDVISATTNMLKDAATLDKNLFKQDGSVNLDFLLPLAIKAASYDSAIKTSYMTGVDRQVKHFESIFSSTMPPLGGPTKSASGTNRIVGKGKSTPAPHPRHN